MEPQKPKPSQPKPQQQNMPPLEFGMDLVERTMVLAKGANSLMQENIQLNQQLQGALDTIKTQATKIKELDGTLPNAEDKKDAENT